MLKKGPGLISVHLWSFHSTAAEPFILRCSTPPPTLVIQEIPEAISIQSSPTVPQGLGFPLMSGSRGNERKCPRRLNKDTALCLSDLPDEILLRIISFLPTKSAIATSLLSRRWKYLWTSTPNLQLDESGFVKRDQFMTFAERALLLHVGSSLVSFSFHICWRRGEDVADYASRINTLITSAIQYNVEQLDLRLRGSFILPFCLFECQSLVKLVLCGRSIRVPSMVSLPRLKHLTLQGIEFEDNESAEKLLSHPSLEELILCYCNWYNVKTVNVNSPKLQSLAIEAGDRDDWSREQQICFFGDNLKFFRYESELPPTQYSICGSTMQLREAEILVGYFGHEIQDMDGPSNRYCKLINSLSMVQNLTLSIDTFESFYRLSQCPLLQTTFPVFERVTRLNLKDDGLKTIGVDSVPLRMLYERCPHLGHLNFMDMIKLFHIRGDTPILRPMPLCFRTHLKKVTIQNYYPDDDQDSDDEDSDDQGDFPAINLLFNSAPVLEQVVIHWKRNGHIPGDESKAAELERKLNARPKVSANCRVSVVLV